MRELIYTWGGRKWLLIIGSIVIAWLNDALALGIDPDIVRLTIYGAVGGAGAIAFEDGLKPFMSAIGAWLVARLGLTEETKKEESDAESTNES